MRDRYIIIIPPYNGGYFIIGHSPNTTGNAQVRLLLACQPCICYLLPVNGSHGSNRLSWSLSLSLFNCSAIYSFIILVFFPKVSTNIPCTKIRGFGIQTSCYHIFEISAIGCILKKWTEKQK